MSGPTSSPLGDTNVAPTEGSGKWQQVADAIAKFGRGYRKDTFLFTLLMMMALYASGQAQGSAIPPFFALLFIAVISVLRHFRAIDNEPGKSDGSK
jgi:hypothetical protein